MDAANCAIQIATNASGTESRLRRFRNEPCRNICQRNYGRLDLMDPVNLIVVVVFDQGDAGELFPVGEPQQFETEERAVRVAKDLASKHAGVLAWSREARPDVGEYGPPRIIYSTGEVLEME